MQDFAFVKKYKPKLTFILETIFILIFSFILFFGGLVALTLNNTSDEVEIFDVIISIFITLCCFFILLLNSIASFKRKKKFNNFNQNLCVIKIDMLNESLYITNTKKSIHFSEIVDITYKKIPKRELFDWISISNNKNSRKKQNNKNQIGNLRIKQTNGNTAYIQGIQDIENVIKKLKEIIQIESN